MAEPTLTPNELRTYSPDAQDALLFIRALPDDAIREAARDSRSDGYRRVLAYMPRGTNPYWITSTCAEVAYDRGVICEQELDWITR